ncbi:MAG: tetratricopeptide repeat protein [Limisphaerales bacterium]
MTDPEELRRRFSGPSRKVRGVIALLLLVAVGSAFYLARPAWRTIKQWRAAGFARDAREARSQGNLGLALQHVRAAFQLQPQDPEITRLHARVLTELGSDSSLVFWQRLAEGPNPSRDDQLSFVEAALGFHQHGLVGPVFSNLLATGESSDRVQRLGALYHIATGASNIALTFARAAYQLEPGNATNALLLSNVLPADAPSPDRELARALLRQVAESDGGMRLMALRRLVHSGIGERSDREWVASSLSGLTKRTPAEEVLLAEALVRLDPTITRLTFSNLIARIPHDDPEMVTLVVEALARLGRHQEVLNLTPGKRGLLNRALFKARFDALSALGHTAEAYQLLLTPGAPMPPFDLALSKIRASVEARDSTRRDAHFEELLDAAEFHPDRLRSVAELAEKTGSLEVAAKAWTRLGTLPGMAATSHHGLQRLADRRGDTWSARDHARQALRAGSTHHALPVEIAFYDLLLEENFQAALAEAQDYANRNPGDFFSRAAVALAFLRLHEPEKARVTLERFLPDGPQPRPDALAVLAATWGENGFVVRAAEIAARVPLDRLRPEELELVRPWIAALPDPLPSAKTIPR